MYRRGVLKSLLAVPVFGTLGRLWADGASPTGDATINKLEIVFDGPFALLLQQNQPAKVTVFTPIEGHDLHGFYANGVSRQETKKRHVLSLVADPGALQPNMTPPKLDPCLGDFNWHTDSFSSSTNNLAESDLPSPDRIVCDDDSITPVKFEDGHLVNTPQGHVLEYTILDSSKSIKMTDSLGTDILPQPSPNPGALRITLQIGMIVFRKNDPDPRGSHAKSFHNVDLLGRFPKLQTDKSKRLDSVGEFFFIRRLRNRTLKKKFFSTTLECKTGGFLVNVP
jgi:hypothetical protein